MLDLKSAFYHRVATLSHRLTQYTYAVLTEEALTRPGSAQINTPCTPAVSLIQQSQVIVTVVAK